jgi:hypothetical protein
MGTQQEDGVAGLGGWEVSTLHPSKLTVYFHPPTIDPNLMPAFAVRLVKHSRLLTLAGVKLSRPIWHPSL